LSVWLSVVIVAMALGAGAISFVSAFREANELQDDQLRQLAVLFSEHNLPLQQIEPVGAQNYSDPDSRVVVQELGPPGAGGKQALRLTQPLADGLQTVMVDGAAWRIVVHPLPGGRRLAVGQQTEVRDEVARHSALRTVMPLVVLIPILAFIVTWLVRRMFVPVARLSAELDRRSEYDLGELGDEHVPDEIKPFTASINRLLARVAQSVEMQRRFVADAAHELRSPMTALSLQVESLGSAGLPEAAQQRLATLRQGMGRVRGLLEQLLSLARSQAQTPPPQEPVSVQAVFRRVLEDLMPLADAKEIDLGVVESVDVRLLSQEIDLLTVVRNLVDNAIRYTPAGGRVDLGLRREQAVAVIQVLDTGPGIQAVERERVFDPFYRILGNDELGSGLGLSIVRAIVDRVGGSVTLADVESDDAASGLCVTVRWPGCLDRVL